MVTDRRGHPPQSARSPARRPPPPMPRPMKTRLLLMLLACACLPLPAAEAPNIVLPPPVHPADPGAVLPSPTETHPAVPYRGPREKPPFAPPPIEPDMSSTLAPAAANAAYGYSSTTYEQPYSWQLMPQGLIYR